MVPSPFDSKINCSIIEKINVADIIAAYKKEYATDTAYIFGDLKEIFICKCPLTGLEFFHPRNVEGDPIFYASLSKEEWYYQVERWEYSKAIEFIKDGDTVLEIGSGGGAFIKMLSNSKKINYCGLELNEEGVLRAKKDGIALTKELLGSHSKKNPGKYNAVCSFQVFEHVSDIKELFEDSASSLAKNGLLIISVPNNGANFIRYNPLPSKYLNMPPHHVNLFTEDSLKKIAAINGLETVSILKENIQPMHTDVYLYYKINKLFLKINVLTRIFWKLKLHTLCRGFVRKRASKIDGHTVLCVFRRTAD